ncbi:hypothetical protein LDO26_14165 [Luteimonas sp. BDR2-5]|uniref:hypothetical protein n=1 Tax=Proluteimonas luteida TaxID=2878685 RepID=UPI001E594516|nr:hypothetical protein [Luteimonas sp. BDR2-5]MCD9029342.1 hypothetical protein [Luteimonas sp. BDR2-5]
MTGKLSIAIVICAVIAALVSMYVVPAADRPAPAASDAAADGVETPALPRIALAPAAGSGQSAWHGHRIASATAATPAQMRAAFERSPDLFALLQSLQTAARAGDAEARWLVSRIHEYCAPVARSPVGYARDSELIDSLGLQAGAALRDARDRVGRRCARFVPTDAPSFVQLVEAREDAALAGSLAAEAALLAMGAPLADDDAYRADLVERVQASRDPEAFVALAPAMGVAASGDIALEGRVAGTQRAEVAWNIAGCRLGQPCGPDSALMTHYCANGGICARNGRQDFETFVRDAALPREDAEEIETMVDVLVNKETDEQVGMVSR